jgi:hypothetical protein
MSTIGGLPGRALPPALAGRFELPVVAITTSSPLRFALSSCGRGNPDVLPAWYAGLGLVPARLMAAQREDVDLAGLVRATGTIYQYPMRDERDHLPPLK